MKRKMDIFGILVATLTGIVAICVTMVLGFVYDFSLLIIALTSLIFGGVVGGATEQLLSLRLEIHYELDNLPAFAGDYIKLVIQYMGYRKVARQEVADELTDHFEAALKNCINEQEKQKKANSLIEQFGDPKLLGVFMRRAKKRCRSLWRTIAARIFQGIIALVIFLILYITWFLSGKPAITTDYVAELNKLARPVADESMNASALYSKALETLIDINDLNIQKCLQINPHDANNEQKEQIRQWLNKNESPLALVTEGTKLHYYWHHYKNTDPNEGLQGVLLPDLTSARRICYALCWRAWLNAEKGNFQSAFDDIKTCYIFGKHNKGQKILIEQLVGMAIEARALNTSLSLLDNFKVNSNVLAYFQYYLQNSIDSENFMLNFQTEKLFMYDEIQRDFVESRFGPSHLYPKRFISIMGEQSGDRLIYSILSPLVALRYGLITKAQSLDTVNRFYAFWDENQAKTPARLHIEGIKLEAIEHITEKNPFLKILIPAFSRVHEYSWRYKIQSESTLVIIALIRYKQDTGGLPESLDELVKQNYLTKVPLDPFSDKPITYHKTVNNFILYSWGSNLKDNGGLVIRDKNGKVRMFTEEGDWVFWPVNKN